MTRNLAGFFLATVIAALSGPCCAQEPKERSELKGVGSAVDSVAISRDGTLLASGGEDTVIRLWNLKKTQLTDERLNPIPSGILKGHTLKVNCLAFSPDGSILASGSVDGTMRLWDVKSGQEKARLKAHMIGDDAYSVSSVAFSSDGKLLASGGYDLTVKLWDVSTGKQLSTLHAAHAVNSIAFSGDGKLLASGGMDRMQMGRIKLWNVATGKPVAALEGHTAQDEIIGELKLNDSREVTCVAFACDDKTLGSASADKTIKLWDVGTSKLQATLRGHQARVSCVAFSPDGMLISGGWDGAVILWDVNARKEKTILKEKVREDGKPVQVYCVALSRDGALLATGGGSSGGGAGAGARVRLWDIPTTKKEGK
jgi:WD40 repeat protein